MQLLNGPDVTFARLQEFHYHPRGSDTCLPCDCYPVGSFSRSCEAETGQCQCRPGVIGRQCNACDNPFAEVTNSGCEGERPFHCQTSLLFLKSSSCWWLVVPLAAEDGFQGCSLLSAVIYDGCPKTITQGIWWPRTKFNLPAAVSCPKGSVGA